MCQSAYLHPGMHGFLTTSNGMRNIQTKRSPKTQKQQTQLVVCPLTKVV